MFSAPSIHTKHWQTNTCRQLTTEEGTGPTHPPYRLPMNSRVNKQLTPEFIVLSGQVAKTMNSRVNCGKNMPKLKQWILEWTFSLFDCNAQTTISRVNCFSIRFPLQCFNNELQRQLFQLLMAMRAFPIKAHPACCGQNCHRHSLTQPDQSHTHRTQNSELP